MKYIAIKLKVINLSDGSILFDPVSAIKGVYNKESDIFVDEDGKQYNSIVDCCDENEFCFFDPVSIDFLRNQVEESMSDEELQEEYYYEYLGSIFVGMYDYQDNEIKYMEIDLEKIANYLYFGIPLFENEQAINSKDKKYSLDFQSLLKLKQSKSMNEVRSYIDDLLKKDISINNFNKNNNAKEIFKLKWTTPYSLLGIEENKYTKAQLLKIIKAKIYEINLLKISNDEKINEINSILDSYNEIIKENKRKTKKLH